MTLDILKEKGVAIDRQHMNWRDMAGGPPISKLDDDAFTRVRVILMNGIEMESIRFSHSFARMNREMQQSLARVRRAEAHQQATINWLIGADHSPIETTIAYEQVAIEVTAALAQQEPDPYLAQVYRFGLLEDFDHLYRYAALLDRLEGKDANNILQCYTDIRPGRPTVVEHRHPDNDLRNPYNARAAQPITKLNALTLLAGEQQTQNYYQNIGPIFADPVARMLYAEIAHIEEQHVTQYESIIDPTETWMEKWLLHEACEVYNYWSCLSQESSSRVKLVWEKFLAWELGHLHFVMDLFQQVERRDPAEIVPATMPEPIKYASQREYVRQTLAREVNFSANGTQIVDDFAREGKNNIAYRTQMNAAGSPSELVAAGYRWAPGTELSERAAAMTAQAEGRLQ